MRTLDFLEELKRRNDFKSDYALAKYLNKFFHFSPNRMSIYRGGGTMDEDTSIAVAEIGGWPEGYVLACVAEERAERTKRPRAKQAWGKVAKALAPAKASSAAGDDIHYTKRRRPGRRPSSDFLHLPPPPLHTPTITSL